MLSVRVLNLCATKFHRSTFFGVVSLVQRPIYSHTFLFVLSQGAHLLVGEEAPIPPHRSPPLVSSMGGVVDRAQPESGWTGESNGADEVLLI